MPPRTKVSDEVLMEFMAELRKDVKEIKDSVSDLTTEHNTLKERVNNHIEDSWKRNTWISVIVLLVGIICSLLGYIWSDKSNNQSNEQRIEKSIQERPS